MIKTKHNSLGFESLKIKTFTLFICLASIISLSSAINCGGSKSDDPAPAAAVDANCETTGASGCSKCKTGYDYDKSGTCKVLPSNCVSLSKNSSTAVCSSCSSGYKVSGDLCVSTNSGNSCSCSGTSITCNGITAGTKFTINGVCNTCASGTLALCATLQPGENFLTSENHIVICNNGYYKDINDICQEVTSTLHCFEADTNGICKTCNIGFSLNNSNECIAN